LFIQGLIVVKRMKILWIDFETCSAAELGGKDSVGLYNYVRHPSTKVLMMAYKLPGSEIVELWQPHLNPMPDSVLTCIKNQNVILGAFNSAFERYLLQYKLGLALPASRFVDPQVGACYLSLPRDLDSCCSILGLPAHLAKDKRGEELIKLFSVPQMTRKKKGEEQCTYFNDWDTHPKEWEVFGEYCKGDLRAEEEVMRRLTILDAWPMPPFERKLWIFDQAVNDRGMPVDRDFVEKAYRLALRSKQEALEAQNAITGLENSNSTKQLLPWVKERGYNYNTLNKNFVDAALKDPDVKMSEECRKVLTARREAASTAYTKLAAILRQVCDDGRLRNQFIYLGSSRCGRWSGSSVQLHNLARPMVLGKCPENPDGYDFENEDVLNDARALVYGENYDVIKARYKSVLLTIKCLIRTVFVAPKMARFQVADLNAIESRVGAWLASCNSLLDVFRPKPGKPNGNCPYLDFAAKLYGFIYDIIEAQYKYKGKDSSALAIKKEIKAKRQVSKAGFLGSIYRQGGGDWGDGKASYTDPETGKKIYDRVRTGLWGFAYNMGVELSQEQAHTIVRAFREAYREIPQFWFALEDAVTDVLKGVNTVRRVGPNGCVVIDKLNVEGHGAIMRMRLPSGRCLHYVDAQLKPQKMKWADREGNEVWRDNLVYAHQNQTTGRWEHTTSHGGKLFENLVQGIARDVLACKLLDFEEADMPVVGHVHDEGLSLIPDDPFSPGVERMVEIMSQPIEWAPGLLLGADGFEDAYYRKG
jgi:DNA polymerase bacteriophage-type